MTSHPRPQLSAGACPASKPLNLKGLFIILKEMQNPRFHHLVPENWSMSPMTNPNRGLNKLHWHVQYLSMSNI